MDKGADVEEGVKKQEKGEVPAREMSGRIEAVQRKEKRLAAALTAQHAAATKDLQRRPPEVTDVQDRAGDQGGEQSSSNAMADLLSQSLSEIQDMPALDRTDGQLGPSDGTPGAFSVRGRERFHTPQVPGILSASNHVVDSNQEEVQSSGSGVYIDGVLVEEDPQQQQPQEDIPEVLETRVVAPPARVHPKSRATWLGIVACFLLAACLVIPLAIVLPDTSVDAPSEPQMEQAGPLRSYPPFLDGLPTATLKVLEDPTSGFYLANQWMWGDPHKDSYSRERQMQRFLMASWYYYLDGDNWENTTHWLDYNVSECEWYSSSDSEEPICDEENWIKVFNVSANNLVGTLPATSHTFSHLRIFDISNNSIGGQTWFRGNDEMEEFVISNNQFDGFLKAGGHLDGELMTSAASGIPIPWNLRVVKLDGNNIFAAYGQLLGLLTNLEVFQCNNNVIKAPLNKYLGSLRKLMILNVADNLYTGTIPTRWGKMSSLRELDLSGNIDVRGTVPSELGLMTDLAKLDIMGTQISGALPEAWCAKVNEGSLLIAANCSLVQCCT